MNKRSAMVISGALVAALLAGMVGAGVQASRSVAPVTRTVVLQTVPAGSSTWAGGDD